MSLAISTHHIIAVLLADGWHDVKPGSFDLDFYEYLDTRSDDDEGRMILGGGTEPLLPAVGAIWTAAKTGLVFYCPLTSVLAVRRKP